MVGSFFVALDGLFCVLPLFKTFALWSEAFKCSPIPDVLCLLAWTSMFNGVYESSLRVAHSGYQVLSDILFRLGMISRLSHSAVLKTVETWIDVAIIITCFGTVWSFWCWCAIKLWYHHHHRLTQCHSALQQETTPNRDQRLPTSPWSSTHVTSWGYMMSNFSPIPMMTTERCWPKIWGLFHKFVRIYIFSLWGVKPSLYAVAPGHRPLAV